VSGATFPQKLEVSMTFQFQEKSMYGTDGHELFSVLDLFNFPTHQNCSGVIRV